MRIAYISYEFSKHTAAGGIGTYTRQIASAMAKYFDVDVFCAGVANTSYTLEGYNVHEVISNDPVAFRHNVVPVFAVQHRQAPFSLMESPEINGNAWGLKEQFPDVPLLVRLHAPSHLVESLKKKYVPFLAKLRFVAGAAKRLKPDLGYWRKYVKENDVDYQFVLMADHITTPSYAMKRWAIENWHIAEQKIAVIPNLFSPSRELLNTPVAHSAGKTVAFFGRLNVLKGLVNASLAMKKILTQFPEWKFKVIGEDGPGPYNNRSMRAWMMEELTTVEGQVNFVGGVGYDEVPKAIVDADIILLPSFFESFSYACAEAMAAGKAVVASKNGGMADLVKNGENGLLVDPNNAEEIFIAVKKIIDNDSERIRYSLQARKTILKEHDPVERSRQYQQYYAQILQPA